MNTVMIIFRVIHIFSGVFWVGFAITNFFYLQPAIKATGSDGQTVMRHLGGKTRLMTTVYIAATLTLISGLGMFHPVMSLINTGYGMAISIGSLAGTIAWILAIFVIRNIINRTQQLGQTFMSQEGPPSEDQLAQMETLGSRMDIFGKVVIGFMVIALLGMSTAQYL
jgi:uncharacterized membrane protein